MEQFFITRNKQKLFILITCKTDLLEKNSMKLADNKISYFEQNNLMRANIHLNMTLIRPPLSVVFAL